MLDVPFAKLTSGAEEQMFAHETWLGIYERHHILQLIAKTERTSRLIVAAASPEAAREGLVQQPAVGQHIDRRIGCLDIHCAEGLIPILPNRFERATCRHRSPKAMGQAVSVIDALPGAQREDDFSFLAFRQIEWNVDRSTGIQTGPHFAGKPRAYHRRGTRKRAVTS